MFNFHCVLWRVICSKLGLLLHRAEQPRSVLNHQHRILIHARKPSDLIPRVIYRSIILMLGLFDCAFISLPSCWMWIYLLVILDLTASDQMHVWSELMRPWCGTQGLLQTEAHTHRCRGRNECSNYVKLAKYASSILGRKLLPGRWQAVCKCVCVCKISSPENGNL